MFIDARIPVRFGPLDSRQPGEAVLTDGRSVSGAHACFNPGPPGHMTDCACCTPRSEAAAALARLFRERALGTGPAFQSVLAVVGSAGAAAVQAALVNDPLVAGRYRQAGMSVSPRPSGRCI